jgi:hypothetical protein
VPSVAIIHETMEGTARAMAKVSGMPDYPFITVGYPYVPLAVWTEEEIRAVARQVAPQVLDCLTR